MTIVFAISPVTPKSWRAFAEGMAKGSKGTSLRSAGLGKPAFQAALPGKYFPISCEGKVDLEKAGKGSSAAGFDQYSPRKSRTNYARSQT